MKKLLALALALVMCLALAACGTSGAPAAGSGKYLRYGDFICGIVDRAYFTGCGQGCRQIFD